MSLRKDIKSISYKGKSVKEDNAFPIKDLDYNQRNSINSVFGEKLVGIRKSDIAAQFQYGYPAGDANSEQLNGGSIDVSNSLLTVSTGTASNGYARINNKRALRYIPGHEAYIFFTCVFTQGVENSYQRAGLFNENNGFFIGFEGENFTVTRRRNSVDSNQTINPNDIFEGFDPTKGNIYKISYGYLGFATISYEVMTPSGEYALIYKDEYPNKYEVSHITNTNLQPRLEVANTGNETDITASTASFTAGIVNGGGLDPSARNFSFSKTAQTITAGTLMVVTFRSKSTFNSLVNYIESVLTLLSFNSDLSKSSLWKFEKNATITNTPTWIDIDTNDSTIEYSTDAVVTYNTGTEILALPLGKADRLLLDNLENQKILLSPGETMTLFIVTPLGTSDTFDLSLRWKELF